jgi:hypothetical protein
MVVVTSSGRWDHRFRAGTGGEADEQLASGFLSTFGDGRLDTTTRGSNRLRLVVIGKKGWLFVNGRYAGTLKFGATAVQGDVEVATGYFRGSEVAGAVTSFEGFTVRTASKKYGPTTGELVLRQGLIAVHSTDVSVADSIVEARFFNPSPGQDDWSYGFGIRDRGPNTFDAVFVRSSKGPYSAQKRSWHHHTRSGTAESDEQLASSLVSNLSTGLRDSNHLLLIVLGDKAWLFVNDLFTATLNLGVYAEQGDVQAFSGYFNDDEAPGAVIRFQDFTVWSP